jgi:hypothetical protein
MLGSEAIPNRKDRTKAGLKQPVGGNFISGAKNGPFDAELQTEHSRRADPSLRQSSGGSFGIGMNRNETANPEVCAGISKAEIARRLQIGRTSVRRILGAKS